MTYAAALDYLHGLLVGARPAGDPDLRLRRMRRLLDAIGLATPPLSIVLVAGTKGKGSTSAMLAAILQAGGHRVGLYTKPHVSDYRERIRLDAEPIDADVLAAHVRDVAPAVDAVTDETGGRPTFFEVSLAVALAAFSQQSARIAVIEAGVGGRFDASNALEPALSVITPVSVDHTDALGGTVEEIAWHKAGIMRPARPVVLAPQVPAVLRVLELEARALGTRVIRTDEQAEWTDGEPGAEGHTFTLRTRAADYGRLTLAMRGAHQTLNAATATVAAETLAYGAPWLTAAAVSLGLRSAVLPGRFEVVPGAPPVVLDVAHNPAAMGALRATLDTYYPGRGLVLVFGMISTHDPATSLAPIADRARCAIVTEADHQRGLAMGTLAALARGTISHVEEVGDRRMAVERALALAGPDDVVCVTGSVYVVGAVRDWLLTQRRSVARSRS
jgi:dihydrofolate synthase / folylpolyglutamate synthase